MGRNNRDGPNFLKAEENKAGLRGQKLKGKPADVKLRVHD